MKSNPSITAEQIAKWGQEITADEILIPYKES